MLGVCVVWGTDSGVSTGKGFSELLALIASNQSSITQPLWLGRQARGHETSSPPLRAWERC